VVSPHDASYGPVSVCLSVCPSVRPSQAAVFCRNGNTDRTGFQRIQGSLGDTVIEKLRCLQKYGVGPTSLWNFVPNSALTKFQHGTPQTVGKQDITPGDDGECGQVLSTRGPTDRVLITLGVQLSVQRDRRVSVSRRQLILVVDYRVSQRVDGWLVSGKLATSTYRGNR